MGKWIHGDRGGEDDRGLTDEGGTRPCQTQEARLWIWFSPWKTHEKSLNNLHFTAEAKGGVSGCSKVPGKWMVEPGSSGGLPEEPSWVLPSSTDLWIRASWPRATPWPFPPLSRLDFSLSSSFLSLPSPTTFHLSGFRPYPRKVLPVLIKQDLPRSSPIALYQQTNRLYNS